MQEVTAGVHHLAVVRGRAVGHDMLHPRLLDLIQGRESPDRSIEARTHRREYPKAYQGDVGSIGLIWPDVDHVEVAADGEQLKRILGKGRQPDHLRREP